MYLHVVLVSGFFQFRVHSFQLQRFVQQYPFTYVWVTRYEVVPRDVQGKSTRRHFGRVFPLENGVTFTETRQINDPFRSHVATFCDNSTVRTFHIHICNVQLNKHYVKFMRLTCRIRDPRRFRCYHICFRFLRRDDRGHCHRCPPPVRIALASFFASFVACLAFYV